MLTRVVNFTGAKDIDGGIRYIRETVAPLLRQQEGFRGITASADREGGVFGVLSLWETQAARDASESALAKTREEGQKIIGGHVSVELFEEVLLDLAGRPKVGSSLLIRRLSMNPQRVEENLDFFKREVLPQLKALPGLLAVRQMVNRETGDAVVGTVWADEASMQSAAEEGARRQQAADGRVRFGEQSRRELVFIELP